MFEAFEPRSDGATYRFRRMSGLVQQCGGTGYHVEVGDLGPRRTVLVTRYSRKANGFMVLATLRVPVEALEVETDGR